MEFCLIRKVVLVGFIFPFLGGGVLNGCAEKMQIKAFYNFRRLNPVYEYLGVLEGCFFKKPLLKEVFKYGLTSVDLT